MGWTARVLVFGMATGAVVGKMTRDEKLALFGEGPWLDEDDQVEFETSGYACFIRRNTMTGTWCGYVGVPAGHPYHGKDKRALVEPPSDFADREIDDRTSMLALFFHPRDSGDLVTLDLALEVHGGVTWAGAVPSYAVAPNDVRMAALKGEALPTDHLWWFGFDCGHYRDLNPAIRATLRSLGQPWPVPPELDDDVYRTQDYAVGEVCRLAAQLRNVELRHFAEQGN